MDKILIINTGGTFNKRYNPLKGELEVPNDGVAPQNVLQYFYNLKYDLVNIIHKDSLDMNDQDREEIVSLILHASSKKIIIIHGTDTMDLIAEFLAERIKDRCVLLTGAMVPLSIDVTEAAANLSTAIGYIMNLEYNGIYISMHGLVDTYDKVFKNREAGIFQSRS